MRPVICTPFSSSQREALFLRDHVGRRRQAAGMKRAQLLDAVALVAFLLVGVFEARRGPFPPENRLHLFERQALPLAQRRDELLDRRVHHVAERGRRARAAAECPRPR